MTTLTQSTIRRSTIQQSACLLLALASAGVAAREVSLQSANSGGGTCPELAAAMASNKKHTASVSITAPVAPTTRGRNRPASVRGEDTDARVAPPRWHSFLPGMFR